MDRGEDLVLEICSVARDRICRAHPYLATALERLRPRADSGLETAATDRAHLRCNPAWLRERFLADDGFVERLLAHALAHCLLGHIDAAREDDGPIFHLACDLQAAMLIADHLPELCPLRSDGRFQELRRRFDRLGDPRTLAERLARDAYVLDRAAELAVLLAVDEHGPWARARIEAQRHYGSGGDGAAEGWRREAARLRRGSGALGAGSGTASLQKRIDLGAADRADFAAYLRRYASVRENARDDPESFQVPWYLYGLERCGAPLIEPMEYREERRLDAFVIAIDTSGSCARGLTQRFLELTRDILMDEGLFFRHFELRILQCDVKIQRDDRITSMREFQRYIENLTVVGGGGTDFRPVFECIDAHIAAGRLRGLKGMLYFSDGRGIFPPKPPSYEVTFAFLKHRFDDIDVPDWVRRLVIDAPMPRGGEYYEY